MDLLVAAVCTILLAIISGASEALVGDWLSTLLYKKI
jgi:hypothetical protein